jgi:HSP20 family molecular chaperone IbpA
MYITNFDWILDEDRIVQNFNEYNFSGVLKKLSPNVNSFKEKNDCYLLVLDLPLSAKQSDIKLKSKNKSLIIFIKDKTLRVKNKKLFSSRSYLFFREVFVPQKSSARLITYNVIDSMLFVKIPKTSGLGTVSLVKLYGQWIWWKVKPKLINRSLVKAKT